jgi:hypothetical protein
MTLLIKENNGLESTVETDLFDLVNGDTGFSTSESSSYPGYLEVSYSPTLSSDGTIVLDYLANRSPYTHSIMGVDSSFVDLSGRPITATGGITDCPTAIGWIGTYYDVTECGGLGYVVHDSTGSPIPDPRLVILFHELAHAVNYATGTDSCSPNGVPLNPSAYEDEAIMAENDFRASLGYAPRVGQTGGCAAASSSGGGTASSTGSGTGYPKCLVVTAVHGSPDALEVTRLRVVRDSLLRGSAFGEEFFARFYSEYDQFSPSISQGILDSPRLKAGVSLLLVEPVLIYLRLLLDYTRGGWCAPTEFNALVISSFKTFTQRFLDEGYTAESLPGIRVSISRLFDVLAGSRIVVGGCGCGSDQIKATFQFVTSAIQTSTRTARYTSWAVLEPIDIVWRSVDCCLNQNFASAAERFAGILPEWLARVPLEPFDSVPLDLLESDLKFLANNILQSPSVRSLVANRLLKEFTRTSRQDLESILERSGIVK